MRSDERNNSIDIIYLRMSFPQQNKRNMTSIKEIPLKHIAVIDNPFNASP